jgi:hypothetical protein
VKFCLASRIFENSKPYLYLVVNRNYVALRAGIVRVAAIWELRSLAEEIGVLGAITPSRPRIPLPSLSATEFPTSGVH